MSSTIQNLLDIAVQDGARSSKFDVNINFNNSMLYNGDISTLVKTTNYPGKTHEVIDFKFKGRSIPLKGQVKYDNSWSCTFYLTQDHKLKNGFEDWIESLDQKHNIKYVSSKIDRAQASNEANGYTSMLTINQLDFHGNESTAEYRLYNVFPKSVSSIDIDYSTVGEILEFTVEFGYSYYDLLMQKNDDGTFADELKSKGIEKIQTGVSTVKTTFANKVKDVFEYQKSLF